MHLPIFHYVNEIPRGTTAKYEIAAQEEFNPITQDTKNGRLRRAARAGAGPPTGPRLSSPC